MGLTAFNLRQYDARLGRWQTPDPYGQHHSPYLAMSNNPVSFTDPDGGYDVYDLQEELWASGLGLSASYSNWDDYYDYRDEQDRFNPGYLVDEVQVFYQFQQCYWWEQVTIAKRTAWVYMESEKTDERISVYISRRHKTTGERVFERVWRDAPKRPGYFDGLLSDLGSAFLETTHVALDLIGMVPALGEAADVVNGLIYLAEGDKWNAGISFAGAAAVIGGQAITGARRIKKGADAVGAANKAPVIIGENMVRVNSYAGKVGGETIDGWLNGRKWTPDLNEEFIDAMKADGRQFMDIGPDFSRRLQNRIDPGFGRPASTIYGNERQQLLDYSNYEKLFQRTGKYQGGVPGFD